MGAVLGVLAGIFVLGMFYKKATKEGAMAALLASTLVVIALKYFLTDVSIWSYSIITIGVSLIVGIAVSNLFYKPVKSTEKVKNKDDNEVLA